MPYQVLARKYRPQTFDEVVGQVHVTETLKNAIAKNRLHHAYLFTGVRGTGKTSLARIFAKSLNCEQGPTPQPCNACASCMGITKGNSLDVIEIDGASNTGVDDVRELREQVKYMPAAGRYKVYIIDEVHMLSTSAFNALLKTLEEPPAHVIFLFATTEAHKIPITILSRCQRFDLRRLSQQQIRERLQSICEREKVAADPLSLDLLARYAEGSMRDGQSLLDMAIGICGEKLDAGKIAAMLGLAEESFIEELSANCLQGDLKAALAKAEEIYSRGFDLRQVALQWVEYLHDLALLKAAGSAALGEDVDADKRKRMAAAVDPVELAALQVAFQTVYRASEEIFRSEIPKVLFDLLLVKLIHGAPYQSLGKVLGGEAETPSVNRSAPEPSRKPASPPAAPKSKAVAAEIEPSEELIARALKKFPPVRAVLDPAVSKFWEGSRFVVVFEKGSIGESMFAEKRALLAAALSQECGTEVGVELRSTTTARPAGEGPKDSGPPPPSDPVVRQAVEILNARVQEVKKHQEG
jgi:DNA polymerase-3 subunit gamma/tau